MQPITGLKQWFMLEDPSTRQTIDRAGLCLAKLSIASHMPASSLGDNAYQASRGSWTRGWKMESKTLFSWQRALQPPATRAALSSKSARNCDAGVEFGIRLCMVRQIERQTVSSQVIAKSSVLVRIARYTTPGASPASRMMFAWISMESFSN